MRKREPKKFGESGTSLHTVIKHGINEAIEYVLSYSKSSFGGNAMLPTLPFYNSYERDCSLQQTILLRDSARAVHNFKLM